MTQQDLADKAGVDLKTIYNLESGARWPIARTRVAVSAALKWDGDALAAIRAGSTPGGPQHPEFPWTPGPAYLSDEEMEAATPLATDILIKILRDGRDPETLTGYDLFGDEDPGLGQAWDSVRQKWAWKYAVWQVASGAAKYAADRGRRRAGGRGALVPG